MRRGGPLAALLVLHGCLPFPTRGPRVDPGLSVSAALTGTAGETYPNGDDPSKFAYGPIGVGLAYGWRPTEEGIGVRVGVRGPVPQGELHLQLPRSLTRIDAGIGGGLSPESYSIYGQVGVPIEKHASLFTTHGWYAGFTDHDPIHTVIRHEGYFGALGLELRHGRTSVQLFGAVLNGRRLERCRMVNDGCVERHPRRAALFGAAVDAFPWRR